MTFSEETGETWDWITLKQAAALAKVSVKTIRRWIADDLLVAIPDAGLLRVRSKHVRAVMIARARSPRGQIPRTRDTTGDA